MKKQIADLCATAKSTGMMDAGNFLLTEATKVAKETHNIDVLIFAREVAEKIFELAKEGVE